MLRFDDTKAKTKVYNRKKKLYKQFLRCIHWSQVTTGCRLDDVLGQPFSWTPEGPEKDMNLMCPWKHGDLYNVLGGVKKHQKQQFEASMCTYTVYRCKDIDIYCEGIIWMIPTCLVEVESIRCLHFWKLYAENVPLNSHCGAGSMHVWRSSYEAWLLILLYLATIYTLVRYSRRICAVPLSSFSSQVSAQLPAVAIMTNAREHDVGWSVPFLELLGQT